MEDDGRKSPFEYGIDAQETDEIDVYQLRLVVERHFKMSCRLRRIADGCHHKIYDILHPNGIPLGAVVRVASPAFPKDKLESEVATYRLLANRTNIPLPRIHTYNSDASNPVGAEYMIMSKVPGTPAGDIWSTLPMNIKQIVVAQVARYFMEIFCLRFATAGSLYHANPQPPHFFVVGPIVSKPFYRAIDGEVHEPEEHPDTPLLPNPDPHRGPYSSVSEYLSGGLRRELDYIAMHRWLALLQVSYIDRGEEERTLELGVQVIKKAIELCNIYPGDILLPANITTPRAPFSLKFDDFHLSDVMINAQTGRVTGFIDLEATTISPVWECAVLPSWLGELSGRDPEFGNGGSPMTEEQMLQAVFLAVMQRSRRYQEWREAYRVGRSFQDFTERLSFRVNDWADECMEEWVDKHLEWAKAHPGVWMPRV